jgi:GntR family transcriptional repressor for pyruvate dehydrogenase complex
MKSQENIFQGIIQSIKKEIILARIKPGEKLLSERRLSEKYGVGRGTIREVLKALETIGLLDVIRGRAGGYFVNERAAEISLGTLSLSIKLEGTIIIDALIFRKMFEPRTCFYAATKRSEKNLEEMERAIKEMEKGADDPDIFAQTNLSFHSEIGKASGNPFIINLYPHIFQMLIDTAKMVHHLPNHVEITKYFHREIFNMIKKKNAEKAEILMDAHLSYFQNDMQQAKELEALKQRVDSDKS